jgi:hypothetical protein
MWTVNIVEQNFGSPDTTHFAMPYSSLRFASSLFVQLARPLRQLPGLPLALAVVAGATLCFAPVRAAEAADAEGAVNACGCGRDLTGSCFCQKVARCGCPGECEPKGCEEKRAKQLEKEILAETRRAAEEDRKRNAAISNAAAMTHSVEAKDVADGRNSGERVKTTEPSRARTPGRLDSASATARPKRMTTSQKRDLAQLLEAYLAENPELRGRTIDQLRNQLD